MIDVIRMTEIAQTQMNGQLHGVSARAQLNMRSDLTQFFSSFFREYDAPVQAAAFDLSIGNVCKIPEVHDVLRDALLHIAKHKLSRLTRYPGTQGYYPLNEKLALLIKKETKMDVSPDELVLTNGGIDGMYGLFYAFCDPGDYVFYSVPSFPYWSVADKAGIYSSFVAYRNPFDYPSTYGDLFAEKARLNSKIKLALISEPHNPISKHLEQAQVRVFRDTCDEQHIQPVLDDVYRSFNEHPWLGTSFDSSLVIADSFSKRFGMPGLRLGFTRMPKEIVPYFRAPIANQVVGVNLFTALTADYVVEQALETKLTEHIAHEIRKRQDMLDLPLRKLGDYGVVSPKPDGGIYRLLVVDGFCEATGMTAAEVAALLAQHGVKMVPADKIFPPGVRASQVLRLSVGGEVNTKNAGKKILEIFREGYR